LRSSIAPAMMFRPIANTLAKFALSPMIVRIA